MKKFCVAVSTILCVVFFYSQAALSWGWAVHSHIDEQFNKKWQIRNANQIYGGLTPDIFNYQFSIPALYMHDQTHNDFMKVWDEAKSKPAKALAFGFVSHNEVWGVDYTAHRSGSTFGESGSIPDHPDEGGYVVAKAYILKGILEQIPEFNALQLPEPLALEVAHELVEYGVDILMKQVDPTIGAKITAAAFISNPNSPIFLKKVYGREFASYFGVNHVDTLRFFISSERQFRQQMILYGQVLMQDDATAVLLISQQLAELSTAFLAAYGLTLPPGTDMTPLLQFGIMKSMELCAPDFTAEIFATSSFVDQQLAAHGITN
ncbi:MAG: hypothetical protein FP814_11890 [Desulfobacterium sp.]|nr:hypothetical protein [Desulfobacterium sp.]MBU3950368.1 hypothetical protein [Pseudomonadota bacterium]MBU4035194.1 hypothetical protein [Pseudomonadota bacterium]